MFLFENTDHYLNFPSQPPHWLPGRKPTGLVELKKPMEGLYYLFNPQQPELLGNVKGQTVISTGATAGVLAWGVDAYGPHIITTGDANENSGTSVADYCNTAFTQYSLFVEWKMTAINSNVRVFYCGGAANGFFVKSNGNFANYTVGLSHTGSSSVTNFTSGSNFIAEGDLVRLGFVYDGTNGHIFAKNITTGVVYTESQACVDKSTSATSAAIFGKDTSGDSLNIYHFFLTKEIFSLSLMEDLVFRDPYQLLIPA